MPYRLAQTTVVLVTLLCLIAPPVLAETPPRQGPEGVVAELVEALNTADLQRLLACFEPDPTVFFPLDVLPLRLDGHEQVAKAFGAFFEAVRQQGTGPRYMNMQPRDLKVQSLGDVAVVTFHFVGGTMVSRRTAVVRRHGDTWKIVHLHASNVPAELSRPAGAK
jgi:ketosteroid isomerase-like protein